MIEIDKQTGGNGMSKTDIIKVIKVVGEGIVAVTRAIGKEWGEQRELEDKERMDESRSRITFTNLIG